MPVVFKSSLISPVLSIIIVSIFPDFSEIRNADRYILFHRSATPFLDIFRTFFRSIYKKYHTMNQICIQVRTRNVLLTCISRQKKRYPHLRISLFQPLTAVSFIFIEISSTISHAVAPEPVHGSARYHHTEPTATPSIIAFAGSLTVLFSAFVLHPVKIIAVIATIPNFRITLPNFFFILSRFSLLCFQIQSKS